MYAYRDTNCVTNADADTYGVSVTDGRRRDVRVHLRHRFVDTDGDCDAARRHEPTKRPTEPSPTLQPTATATTPPVRTATATREPTASPTLLQPTATATDLIKETPEPTPRMPWCRDPAAYAHADCFTDADLDSDEHTHRHGDSNAGADATAAATGAPGRGVGRAAGADPPWREQVAHSDGAQRRRAVFGSDDVDQCHAGLLAGAGCERHPGLGQHWPGEVRVALGSFEPGSRSLSP